MHAVMKHWHPMIGRDLHIPWVPGTPAPAPAPVPYITFSLLFGFGVVASYAKTHHSMGWGFTMQKGTDIGFLIPHFGPPSLLTPLDVIFSASKSYFGPAAIQAEGKPIAAALLIVVNPNLNCGTPIPVPFGAVLAINTHFVGMTLGDIIHGLLSGAIDFVIQWAIGKIMGPLCDWIAGKIAPPLLSKAAAKALLRQQGGVPNRIINQAARDLAAARAAQTSRLLNMLPAALRSRPEAFNAVVNTTVGTVVGFFTGGPMGLDIGTFGAPTPGGAVTDGSQGYLNDSGVDQWGTGGGSAPAPTNSGPAPSPAPASTPTPTPAPTPAPTPTPTPTMTPAPGDDDGGVCMP